MAVKGSQAAIYPKPKDEYQRFMNAFFQGCDATMTKEECRVKGQAAYHEVKKNDILQQSFLTTPAEQRMSVLKKLVCFVPSPIAPREFKTVRVGAMTSEQNQRHFVRRKSAFADAAVRYQGTYKPWGMVWFVCAIVLFIFAVISAPLLTKLLLGEGFYATMMTQSLIFGWLSWAMCGFFDRRVLLQTKTDQKEWEQMAKGDFVQPEVLPVPQFKLNLDLPPDKRWAHIVAPYIARGDVERLKTFLVGYLVATFGRVGGTLLTFMLRILLTCHVRFVMPSYFRQELLGMSVLTYAHGLTYFDLLLLAYGTDFVANCTAAVVGKMTNPMHLRNIDWFPQQSLRHLTAEIQYECGGKKLYTSTSWVFFVGTHTCMRHGAYSLTTNFRMQKKGVKENVIQTLKGGWPHALLLRHMAQSQAFYGSVTKALTHARLIAPCYVVAAGCGQGEGMVIERNAGTTANRTSSLDDKTDGPLSVLITNCDSTTNILKLSDTQKDPLLMNSILRREKALALIEKYFGQLNQPKDCELLCLGSKVLTAQPLNNYQTTFGVIMVPGLDMYESRLWPAATHSRCWDERLGGAFTDADLKLLNVQRD